MCFKPQFSGLTLETKRLSADRFTDRDNTPSKEKDCFPR